MLSRSLPFLLRTPASSHRPHHACLLNEHVAHTVTQDPRGFWDPTESVAASLLAQKVLPADVTHLKRRASAVAGLRNFFVLGATEMEGAAGDDVATGAVSKAEADICPVTGFDAAAIEWCMPEALRRFAEAEAPPAGGGGDDGEAFTLKPLRIWVRTA